jgi:tRNA threonylcarbamoyladenosine biosynthesis protein TsaB
LELTFDTSTRYASVAVSSEGEVVSELAWRSERNHSVELVPALRQLMAQARVRMEEVGAVFVARGPGGFSALRVGISVAKSLAAARAIPVVAVGTLDVEAQPYLGLDVPVCALVRAGRTKLYAAIYPEGQPAGDGSGERYSVETPEGLASLVSEDTLLCGEEALLMAGLLRDGFGVKVRAADSPPPTRRPGVLARLAYRRLEADDTDDPETLQPIYMRGSQFEAAQRNTKTR